MKTQSLTLGLGAFVSLAQGHTLFSRLFIDGEQQGDGTCLRMPKDGETSTYPIDGLTSDDMACGKDGNEPAAYVCPAAGSSTLTFEFRSWPNGDQDGFIDDSHKGPCAVYVKPVSDMFSDKASGPGWTKIWHEGYDESTEQWCTEKIMETNGLMSFELPSGLPAGYYLVRPELLALHAAYSENDPQYYVGCAQIYIEDGPSGSLDDSNSVSIPGYVDGSESGNTFNLYQPDWPYIIPGPDPVSPNGTSSGEASVSANDIDGAVPTDCMVKNANWCAKPLESYSDEKGCWAAVEDCYNQSDDCFNPGATTGVKGCDIWLEEMCHVVQKACEDKDFNGPPEVELSQVNHPKPGDIPPAVNKGAGQTGGENTNDSPAGGEDKEEEKTSTPVSSAPSYPTPSEEPESTDDELPGGVYIEKGNEVDDDASETTGAAKPEVTEPASDEEEVADDETAEEDNTESDSGLTVSPDGTCGGETGYTCLGSTFGSCCSKKGKCGRKTRACGCGCQSAFGECSEKPMLMI